MSETAPSAHELRTHHRIGAPKQRGCCVDSEEMTPTDRGRKQDDRKVTMEVN